MPTGPNSGEWGSPGPTGWVTRWVLGTAIGQIVFTGTVRLVLAVLMGAALGGLAVWLVLRRRLAAQRGAAAPVTGTAGRADRRVRPDAGSPNPAYPGRPSRPGAERARPRFSPRAARPRHLIPEQFNVQRAAPGRPAGARATVNGSGGVQRSAGRVAGRD